MGSWFPVCCVVAGFPVASGSAWDLFFVCGALEGAPVPAPCPSVVALRADGVRCALPLVYDFCGACVDGGSGLSDPAGSTGLGDSLPRSPGPGFSSPGAEDGAGELGAGEDGAKLSGLLGLSGAACMVPAPLPFCGAWPPWADGALLAEASGEYTFPGRYTLVGRVAAWGCVTALGAKYGSVDCGR